MQSVCPLASCCQSPDRPTWTSKRENKPKMENYQRHELFSLVIISRHVFTELLIQEDFHWDGEFLLSAVVWAVIIQVGS